MFPNTQPKNVLFTKKKRVPEYSEDMLKGVLARYDIDGDGVLTRKELKEAFKAAGSSFPGWRAIRALCHADKNRDGVISEKELNNLVSYATKRGRPDE
ncbi:hypothetical protein TIFTF001_005135 [Ficus carica]|uniref:EF-hand domain-containing protein n=1 Tax=Ficus carica TaxID=3494 RepID=A0AA87ZLE6_FICCA|nr:hypothetical protein TIFTF001_005135 [Ficus carica]